MVVSKSDRTMSELKNRYQNKVDIEIQLSALYYCRLSDMRHRNRKCFEITKNVFQIFRSKQKINEPNCYDINPSIWLRMLDHLFIDEETTGREF